MPDEHTNPARLGGMALANGLLVHGPRMWAAAVRDGAGELRIASGRKPRLAVGALAKVPLLRGVLRLGEAMAVVPAARRGLPQARLAMEDGPVGLTVAGSLALAAIARRMLPSVLAQEAVGAVAGLAPALVALRRSDAAMWHGVEHKSIAAYESGGSAADEPKEHDRCGSNLILPMLVATTAGNAFARKMFVKPTLGARLAIGAVSMGAAVEAFVFASRKPEHPLSRAMHGFGHAIQSGFATREPTAEELSVGKAAMDELLRAEQAAAGAPAS